MQSDLMNVKIVLKMGEQSLNEEAPSKWMELKIKVIKWVGMKFQ